MGSKTGANFRLRFSESKIGTGFRPQKSAPIFDSENRRGQKSDDDAVENRNKIKNVIEMYINRFYTVYKQIKQKQ